MSETPCPMTSTQAEIIMAYLLGYKLVTNVNEQYDDRDLVAPDGVTTSVKYQKKSAETKNISLEEKLICTRTGETRPGNFMVCTAPYCLLVLPTRWLGTYDRWDNPEVGDDHVARIWLHSDLDLLRLDVKDQSLKGRWPRLKLSRSTHASNYDRKFDQAENAIIPRRYAFMYNNEDIPFSYKQVTSGRGYKKFERLYLPRGV